MRVTMRGYSRDHGSFELADEQLGQMVAEVGRTGCPQNGTAVLEQVLENGGVTEFKFRRRVHASLNGYYALEVSLTPADAAKLCWLGFRNSALSVLTRLFGVFEQEEIEREKVMLAEGQRLREERLKRRRLV
jgi:hypothetical protein